MNFLLKIVEMKRDFRSNGFHINLVSLFVRHSFLLPPFSVRHLRELYLMSYTNIPVLTLQSNICNMYLINEKKM